jgi:DNA-binding MarR family transcriptional regulator
MKMSQMRLSRLENKAMSGFMSDTSGPYQQLFEEIRKLHNRLRWLGDQIHEDMGQTSAKRSLLLSLHREGPCTVPELAKERLVSRQIIQTQINLLLEDGLVVPRANPRHKRSKHLGLTRKGRELVEKMLAREEALLEDIGSPLTPSEVTASAASLATIRKHLEAGYQK